MYTVGTLYVVYQALNNTKFKADKFILLVASIAILIVFAGLVVYLDRQILEQAIMGSIKYPNFGDLGNLDTKTHHKKGRWNTHFPYFIMREKRSMQKKWVELFEKSDRSQNRHQKSLWLGKLVDLI